MARFALCEIIYEADAQENLFGNDNRWYLGSLVEVDGESAEEILNSAPAEIRFFTRKNNVTSAIIPVGGAEPTEEERWYTHDYKVYSREDVLRRFDQATVQFALTKANEVLIDWKESLERSRAFLHDGGSSEGTASKKVSKSANNRTNSNVKQNAQSTPDPASKAASTKETDASSPKKETSFLKPVPTKKRSKKEEKEKARKLLQHRICRLHEKMKRPVTKRELADSVNCELGTTVGERTLFDKATLKLYESWKTDYSNRTVKKKQKSPES